MESRDAPEMKPYYDDGKVGYGRGVPKSPAHRAKISKAQKRAWANGRKGGGWGTGRKRLPIGSKKVNTDGYVHVKVHPGTGTWRAEHLLVMEKEIGRPLAKAEIVHHVDLDRGNNPASNLYLCRDRRHHNEVHRSADKCFQVLLKAGLAVFKNGKYEAVLRGH